MTSGGFVRLLTDEGWQPLNPYTGRPAGPEVRVSAQAPKKKKKKKLSTRVEVVVRHGFYRNKSGYIVTTPYRESALRDLRSIPGRKWLPKKGNFIPFRSRRALWDFLCEHYENLLGRCPRGRFFRIKQRVG